MAIVIVRLNNQRLKKCRALAAAAVAVVGVGVRVGFLKVTVNNAIIISWLTTSVTRLGNFFHFGQLFEDFCNNLLVQIFHILRQFL